MTIDVRQELTCSAGPLISATVLDDYVSQSGLITTRGECQIAGTTSANLGSTITFTGVNRTLKVIGKSYSPLDNITYLQFTCPVGLGMQAQNLDFRRRVEESKPVPEWWPTGAAIPSVTVSSIVADCAAGMGLSDLTSVPVGGDRVFLPGGAGTEYEFTGTYASTLAAILATYGHYGFASGGGIASARILGSAGGGTVFLDENSIIATGPLGAGNPPAGQIAVSFTVNGLKAWSRELGYPKEVCSTSSTAAVDRFIYYNFDTDVEDPDNDPEERSITYSYAPTSTTCSYFDADGKEYLTVETSSSTGQLDNYAANLATAGFDTLAEAAADRICTQVTTTARSFDVARHVTLEVVEVRQEVAVLGSSLNLPFARPEELTSTGDARPAELVYELPGSSNTFIAERVERQTEVLLKDIRLTTRRWLAGGYTPEGQQAAAEFAKDTRDNGRMLNILSQAQMLIEQPEEVQVLQGAAEQWNTEIRLAQELADAQEEAGATENTAIVFGATTSNDQIVLPAASGMGDVALSLPFVPDTLQVIADVRTNPDGSTELITRPAGFNDIAQLARGYARDYQALATAMRYGFNVQVGLDKAPVSVGQLYQVSIRGTAGLYISTGASFQLNAEGGICSMDLLYLGGVGSSSGDFWVPAIGPLPPLPPTMTDPVTGDTVYDLTDVVLVPAQNPPALQTEGGIRLGVEAFSFTGPAVTTKVAEVGLALGSAITSDLA